MEGALCHTRQSSHSFLSLCISKFWTAMLSIGIEISRSWLTRSLLKYRLNSDGNHPSSKSELIFASFITELGHVWHLTMKSDGCRGVQRCALSVRICSIIVEQIAYGFSSIKSLVRHVGNLDMSIHLQLTTLQTFQ